MVLSVMGLLETSQAWNSSFNTMWSSEVENTEYLYYKVTNVSYGEDNFMPVDSNNASMGIIALNDILTVQIHHLEDLSTTDDKSFFSLTSDSSNEWWNYEYQWNVSSYNYMDWGGPMLLQPVITVPQTTDENDVTANDADWEMYKANWEANGFSVHISEPQYDKFEITGPTSSEYNITEYHQRWLMQTGIMDQYMVSGTTDDGTEYRLWLEYDHTQGGDGDGGDFDPVAWGIYWGVDPGLMWSYDLTINSSEGVPLGDSSMDMGGEQLNLNEDPEFDFYMYDGDLLVFILHELSNFSEGMWWKGSAMTDEYNKQYYYDFDTDFFPRTWYPIFPLGNEQFYGNVTEMFEEEGATVTWTTDTLTLQFNDGMMENGTWDLNTGLLTSMYIEQPMRDNEGNNFTIALRADLVYEFNAGKPIYSSNWMSERYILDHVQNGTSNYLDFGTNTYYDEYNNEYENNFRIYDGDVFSVWAEYREGDDGEGDDNGPHMRWFGKTSSGYWIDAKSRMSPPGMGFDGPPLFYFMIPIGNEILTGQAWWDELTDLYHELGWDISETADSFTILIPNWEGEMDVTAEWSKTTGVLEYYKIDGTIEGNIAIWEMHRGIDMPDGENMNLNFGVAAGTTMDYKFTEVTGSLPFGEAEDTYIVTDDIMTVTFLDLSLEDGPEVYVDMEVDGVTQANVSMGMQEPGFEFAQFNDAYYQFHDQDHRGGGPALLYFAIPVGDQAWWDWVDAIYDECGYVTSLTTTEFSINVMYGDIEITVAWSRDNGLMQSYSYSGPAFDGEGTISFSVERVSEDVITSTPPTTTTTPPVTTESNDTEPEQPGLPIPVSPAAIYAIPFLGIATVIVRRKKNY
ncbi:MAG: hypothetical protein INQ03_03740 [Candidatus Heimdallarchaeota archaeon]|nr:hypothetical protein [Candidatus Heimdallarchaeota archaeon]